jgi:hypothetical protein
MGLQDPPQTASGGDQDHTTERFPLRPGLAASVGSLPHTDASEAARLVLELHPRLPAAPQLPGRDPHEGMIAQAARGLRGVTVDRHGAIVVEPGLLDPGAPVEVAIDEVGHAGLLAFLDAAAGRTEPVKVQLTGPVTLGLALVEAGAPASTAFAVALPAVQAHGRALVARVRRQLPDAPLVVVLDEPGLTAVGHDGYPLDAEATIDLLSGALAVLESEAVTGVHCCGPTDLRLLAQAGSTLISVPATPDLVQSAGVISTFLERGGWFAWGAVPTHGPVGDDPDRLWRALTGLWCELVRQGCDPALLRRQGIVTPACGLAGHGASQAERALRLAAEIAGRVHDQAVAARLSVGA